MEIPPGAFSDAAIHETRVIKREDGHDVAAFSSRAKSLTAMRSETIALREDVDELKQEVAALPFPFAAR